MARHEIDPREALAPPWSDLVSLAMLPQGVIVRADDEPSLGDLNTLELPDGYLEVAQRLAPWMPREIEPFPWWTDDDETLKWSRRFTDPEGWA